MKKEKFEFEIGDLVIEHLDQSYYLTILTAVAGRKAQGWVIDGYDAVEEYFEVDKPFYTREQDESFVRLNECEVLIKNFWKG